MSDLTAGPIARHLAEDHARLAHLLALAIDGPDGLAREPFDAFRAGLLRHIALEEKILFRAVRETKGASPALLELLRHLRVDHGAIASLLVPTPSRGIVTELRVLLAPHDEIEEAPGGPYEHCDELLASRAEELVLRMRAYPPVRVAPYADGPRVLRTADDALRVSARQHHYP